jgi:hypothetical protein
VSSLELDDDVLSIEDLLQAAEDLLVEALLNLRASCEVLNDSVELRETDDLAIGEVADMCDATEEEEVVLTHGGEWDVALEDDRVGRHRESGASREVIRLEAGTELLHVHLGYTVRSLLY